MIKVNYRKTVIWVMPGVDSTRATYAGITDPGFKQAWVLKDTPDPMQAMCDEITEVLKSFAARHALTVDEIICTLEVTDKVEINPVQPNS